MKKSATLSLMGIGLSLLAAPAAQGRTHTTLRDGWQFSRIAPDGTPGAWQQVRVPHDWAVHEPFSGDYEVQMVAVTQNGEQDKSAKTGRTGGLNFLGKGVYTNTFQVADTANQVFTLLFDGAMSRPKVTVNGQSAGHWAYGYNSFYLDLPAGMVKPGENSIKVELENFPYSSRWYPGAGLYRNVHIIANSRVHIPVWGTYITTPYVGAEEASVRLVTEIEGAPKGKEVTVTTEILDPSGKVVATERNPYYAHGQAFTQNFLVKNPNRWSIANPALYEARTTLSVDGRITDQYTTRFGIRSIEYIPTKGFFLNGEYTKFKGVCNHHDLGPLGAAVNRSALRHQIQMLKDMGANAIRTSHNMPAPELVELCDEMGMMLMVESFDDWGQWPKCANGYGSIFNEWAERDVTNMVRHYRNNPSVVMWSIGNEVPSQGSPVGVQELEMLQNIVHRTDPTRPVTCGMDQVNTVLYNGFAAALDIPGFNYKPQFYTRAYDILPQKLILGSETASTVSSRGVYHFPAMKLEANAKHPDSQSSSYDTEMCYWSNIPDIDFAADELYPWMIGQFVWTGFDYLGEPTPYDTDAWPSHSSVFGIIDLASLPKDRYYLYRSVWNTSSPTLHMLPHWTWKGREGKVTPVVVYTSYPSAELFVNGKSQGKLSKAPLSPLSYPEKVNGKKWHRGESLAEEERNDSIAMPRYRLIWDKVVYEPGEVKVVAYDAQGRPVDEIVTRTAGKPHHLVLTPAAESLRADGDDLLYVTVQVADKDGNLIPADNRMVQFAVSGPAEFLATANGDPTCTLPMDAPRMKLFSGAATAIVRAGRTPGTATLTVTAPGLPAATLPIAVK